MPHVSAHVATWLIACRNHFPNPPFCYHLCCHGKGTLFLQILKILTSLRPRLIQKESNHLLTLLYAHVPVRNHETNRRLYSRAKVQAQINMRAKSKYLLTQQPTIRNGVLVTPPMLQSGTAASALSLASVVRPRSRGRFSCLAVLLRAR